ncbi:hypothetical protein RIF29_31233 [Crotalaria pallida]|uniref:Cystatin domain-containing protein n=1 Tax=Crotalaria pallida TaxID=3830 RepID=A0AAN9EHB7_CROPI
MMKVGCLLLLLSVIVIASTTSAVLLGGWSPIENVNDKEVVEIANFAISEYDKRSGATLTLVKVIKGETQVVGGYNYRLVLAANDNKNYEAVVFDAPWEHVRNLTSFDPIIIHA